jgi:hypothetical protein
MWLLCAVAPGDFIFTPATSLHGPLPNDVTFVWKMMLTGGGDAVGSGFAAVTFVPCRGSW